MSRLRRPLLALGLLLALLTGTPGVASAHAQLESSDPGQSAVLLVPPTQIVLHFGEPVEIDFGSIQVIGPGGTRVDGGAAHHPAGDDHGVAVSLPANLPDGTFVVSWRVVSADSHPVHGAYVFSVGSDKGAARAGALAAGIAGQSGDSVVGLVYWGVRTVAFVGLLLLAGLSVMVAWLWRDGGRSRRVARVLWWSWAAVVAATLAGLAVQGVYASALPIADAYRPSLIAAVLRTRFGEVAVLRLVLLAAMVPVLLALRGRLGPRTAGGRWVVPAATGLGLGLLVTPGLAGHAASGDHPLVGILLDVSHLVAASAWLGGLALLATFLVPRTVDDVLPPDPEDLTLRVSSVAFAGVAVVVATGVVQSIRQVGSTYALVHTSYGQTLMVKIGLVVVLVGLGAVSRRLVHGRAARRSHRPDGPSDGSPFPRRRLRRMVTAELVLAVAVVGVTAALVNEVPAGQAAGLPFTYSFSTFGVQVNTIVDPSRAGPANRVHVYVLSNLGTPKAVPELDMSISLPSQSIGPIAIPLVIRGPGHYYARRVDIPVAGNWTLKFTVRTDAIDEQVRTTTLPVH